jgi:hypothetical protein
VPLDTVERTYYAVTRVIEKSITAYFEINGASAIGDKHVSCTARGTSPSCKIVAPNITRSGGWTVVGWSINAGDRSTSAIKIGSNIVLTEDITYYAITRKTVTMNFEPSSNRISSVGAAKLSCTLVTTQTSCVVDAPSIKLKNPDKDTVRGWHTDKNRSKATGNIIKPGENVTLTESNNGSSYYAHYD